MWADWYQSLVKMRGESTAGVPRINLGEGARIHGIIIKNAHSGTNVCLSQRLFFCAFVGTAAINSLTRDLEEMMRERGLSIDHTTV
ncbi:MAG: hypothetical protein WCB68_08580 [Pyrinomonadaceae bacterium]